MKKLVFIFSITAILTSCNSSKKEETNGHISTEKLSNDFSLIGKKALLTYPELSAEVTYGNGEVHWKTTDSKDSVAEQTNALYLKPIGKGLFFASWIEDDGTTVSQVIDTEQKSVKVFLTYPNEQGTRHAQELEGTLEWK